MPRFCVCFLLCAAIASANDWVEYRLGPFEVASSRGDREAKETLNFLEQLRYALGSQLGQNELESTWPIRIALVDKGVRTYPTLQLARDAWVCSITDITPATAASVVTALLDSWPGTLPPHIRRGLISLYSTLQVDGTRVTLGAVPAEKDRDWSRAHMLAVTPDYSGKLRVLLGNLSKGVDRDVAYRNAFAQSPEQIERALDKYMESGRYGTIPAASRAISVRQFLGKPLDARQGQIILADVDLAHGNPTAGTAFEGILKAKPGSVEAEEGLGLLALKRGDRDTAKRHLAQAASARPLYEYARILDDAAARRAALTRATQANPKWAEPYILLAQIETHPAQKLAALRKAAQLQPQRSTNWLALAAAQEDANQLAEAAKSWGAAERATDDPEERERIRQTRVAGQQKRDEAVRAAREAERRKAEQEIEDLRNKALMEIRQAEARANQGKPVIDASGLDEYKEGPQTKTATGVLQRVDCLGVQARLHVGATRILVQDPSKVAISGGGERSFGCGVQKPARKVKVEYTPRKDAQQGTVGDAVTIEFQ